jgi:beta-glucosidase
MADAVNAAQEADIVIFIGGINYEIEGETKDRYNWTIDLPGKQVELINRIKGETGKPVVVVLIGGGAMRVNDFIDNVDALIMAGYPGMEGGNAIADILFGDYNPNGKLTMTFPVDDDQMPDFGSPGDEEFDFSNDIVRGVGYRYYDAMGLIPQYAFGYGLSYSTFELSNLKINGIAADQAQTIEVNALPVSVSVDIANTGDRQGAEVVQLYLGWDETCSVPMPIKQLKGFEKINLAPGKTATVGFELGWDELSFYDVNTGGYIVEQGQFKIMVGNSSDNLQMLARFQYGGEV